MSNVKYATNRLIDSVWTLAYIENADNTVTVVSYDRNNDIGYEREKELPRVKVKEGEGRIVESVVISKEPILYPWLADEDSYNEPAVVANPKHVFSYSA